MGSTFVLLGLSLFTALAADQPEDVDRLTPKRRQYQIDCRVVLHRAVGQRQLLAEPHLVTIESRPASFMSGGETRTGKPFGTLLDFFVARIDRDKVHLKSAVELSRPDGVGDVETIVRFRCDKQVELGRTIRLKKKDPLNPDQFYRATFRVTEVQPVSY